MPDTPCNDIMRSSGTWQWQSRVKTILLLLVAATGVSGCRSIRPPRGAKAVEQVMMVTGYCQCGKCCGWQRDWRLRPVYTSGPNKGKIKAVGRTASGTAARPGTLAADGALYPFGTVMYVEGYGYGRVEDRGAAIKGNRLDVFFPSHRAAVRWGVRRMKVKIWMPPASGAGVANPARR